MQVPDADLLQRISGQKVDPLSGVTYTKSILDPPKPAREQAFGDLDEDEEDDGVAENEDDIDHDVVRLPNHTNHNIMITMILVPCWTCVYYFE